MNQALIHRGPDDSGYYFDEGIGLGHRRLSIIDLNSGHQPIFNEDKTVVIVFNGEIYNFKDLRKKTELLGHRYLTNTDTETIVHLYEEYGEECLNELNGMFAFALWDSRKKKLFLARDRLGIKPLYYYSDDDHISFASELKAIIKDTSINRAIDKKALVSYFSYEYVPSPLSIIENVNKLPPAHALTCKDGSIKVYQYWDIANDPQRLELTEQNYKTELFVKLKEAVRLQMVSDVPIGAFLSGGIDSSSIVGLMAGLSDRQIETFSVGFEDISYNELEYARAVANRFNTKHHEIILAPDIQELTTTVVEHLDEPFADVSAIPTYLISKFAKEQVKVILSGDGGDELFAGYERYVAQSLSKWYRKIPEIIRVEAFGRLVEGIGPTSQKKGFINKLKRFHEGETLPDDLAHLRWQIFLSESLKKQLFTEEFLAEIFDYDPYDLIRNSFSHANGLNELDQQLYVDATNYLPDDILTKVDRMSMAVSLETRVPYLDHNFVEYAFSIPARLKLKGNNGKYIFKEAMRGLLPEEIIKRRKEGFSIPVKNWLKNDLKDIMLAVLDRERMARENIFDYRLIDQLVSEHISGKANNAHQLWSLIVFELWLEHSLGTT